MKVIITCLFLFVFSFFEMVSAQETDKVVLKSEPHKINNSFLKDFFYEVHKGSPYEYDRERERIYLEQLSRIEIIPIPYVENNNLKNLSSIDKMNKYNTSLSFDISNFDPVKFNFIKYSFNFYSTSDQFIRVDNKDYIIHILPYTNN